jgi:AraC-like DNA-binding protein
MLPAMSATVSTIPMAFEVSTLAALGVDTDRVLGLAGLTRERVADPHGRLPVEALFRFWDAAIRVSGDPSIGLRVGASIHQGALGGFEYMLRHSASMRQCLDRAERYMRLVDDVGRVDLVEAGELAALRVSRRGGYPYVVPEIECLFAAWRSILDKEWPGSHILAVRFAHACPTTPAAYVRHFGCSVRWGEEHNEVEFPAALLDVPARHADAALGEVLEDHARHLLDELPDGDPFIQAARSELRAQLGRGAPSIVLLARALHMSERTLRRHLDAQGTSYQALLEELREELACHYVARTKDGFDVIAERLAFADASTFFRAFKRWTGTTPAQYRARS